MFKIIKAAGGVVKNSKDEILFIYRLKKWDLPKGKLDKGETIMECAKREVEEETKVKVECGEKIISTWHTYTRNKKFILKKTTWYKMNSLDDSGMKPQKKENIEKAAGCLKVLAHPARLQIMCALRNGEQTVQDLEFLTGLRQTTLSQHLSLLKNRDVLASRREANFSFYRIANMRMVELFNLVQDIFCHTPKES